MYKSNFSLPTKTWILLEVTSVQMNTFFLIFCPVCCLFAGKARKKVFNWTEVHLYRSDFLQNPYFKYLPPILFKNQFLDTYILPNMTKVNRKAK